MLVIKLNVSITSLWRPAFLVIPVCFYLVVMQKNTSTHGGDGTNESMLWSLIANTCANI